MAATKGFLESKDSKTEFIKRKMCLLLILTSLSCITYIIGNIYGDKIDNRTALKPSAWITNKEINYTNIMTLDPPIFLPQYKNPCYEIVKQDNNGREITKLNCLPYFYLAGFPKCGTTDLYRELIEHKQIVPGKCKEPHWWTRKRFFNISERNISSYLERFDKASQIIRETCITTKGECYHNQIFGDASASTVWDNYQWRLLPGNEGLADPDILTASHIHHVTPFTKIILLVRDPVERLYSDFLYFCRYGNSSKPLDAFHKRIVYEVGVMRKCMMKKSARNCAYNLERKWKIRLQIGMYSVFLEDWLRILSHEQIHVLKLEDYSMNNKDELLKIFDFLEIDSPPDSYFDTIEKMERANTRVESDRELGPMWPKTAQMLKGFYAPYNRKLAKLLQNNKFLWKS